MSATKTPRSSTIDELDGEGIHPTTMVSHRTRDPAGRAAAYLHREAAGGPVNAGQLQHPKGVDPAPRAPPMWWHHRALLQALSCKYNQEKMICRKPKGDMVLTCAGAHQPWKWNCVHSVGFTERCFLL